MSLNTSASHIATSYLVAGLIKVLIEKEVLDIDDVSALINQTAVDIEEGQKSKASLPEVRAAFGSLVDLLK